MKINYICRGFDKDSYNFDAVVIPVREMKFSKSEQEVCGFRLQFLNDFRDDFVGIMWKLPLSAFRQDGVTVVRSEKTGIYYIFILLKPVRREITEIKERKISYLKNYVFCCEKMIEYINKLDVENIFVHPAFNQADFMANKDSDFLAETLKKNIDRFSRKNIYIFVEDMIMRDHEVTMAISRMEKGEITYKECTEIFVKNQIEKSMSYTNNLIRIAEIETKYKPKTIAEQFIEDMNNDSRFFYEYVKRYTDTGTAVQLAKNANISSSAISKIKDHTYKSVKKYMAISLAIALDLTVEARKRFINSAGFGYPITDHDRFIEQQLRKKKYTRVIDFNNDIGDEYPQFVIKKE